MIRNNTPPVVLNLILINVVVFMMQQFLPNGLGDRFTDFFGLHYWESPLFRSFQFFTHMFLHGSLTHLFANMFALWMFGRILEYDLGSRRFLIYYLITGIGAGLLHSVVMSFELKDLIDAYQQYGHELNQMQINNYFARLNVTTVGASGAVFGVLLAFGMMHPNDVIMLLIPPIPMKAKYFVIIYGLIELMLGVTNSLSNIAHFAHVGGMIFGFLLLYYWKKSGKIYY